MIFNTKKLIPKVVSSYHYEKMKKEMLILENNTEYLDHQRNELQVLIDELRRINKNQIGWIIALTATATLSIILSYILIIKKSRPRY